MTHQERVRETRQELNEAWERYWVIFNEGPFPEEVRSESCVGWTDAADERFQRARRGART